MKRFAIIIPFAIMAVFGCFAYMQDRQEAIKQETDAECSSGMNSVYHSSNRLIRNDSAFEREMTVAMAGKFDTPGIVTVKREKF